MTKKHIRFASLLLSTLLLFVGCGERPAPEKSEQNTTTTVISSVTEKSTSTSASSTSTQAVITSTTDKTTKIPTRKPSTSTKTPDSITTKKTTLNATKHTTTAPVTTTTIISDKMTTVNVPKLKQNNKKLPVASIKEYQGTIDTQGKKVTYSYTAPRDGIYCFTFTEVMNGTDFKFYVYDELNNAIAGTLGSFGIVAYAENGDAYPVRLKGGKTYTFEVIQHEGYSSYVLQLGISNPVTDISPYCKIEDSIVFTNQENVYTFSPENNGQYVFEFSGVKNGTDFKFYIYDHLGNLIEGTYDEFGIFPYAKNGSCYAAILSNEEVYTIKVIQNTSAAAYTLNIGKRKPNVPISENYVVNDCIEYESQCNVYLLTVKEVDRCTVTLSGIKSGMEVEVYVYNELDEVIFEKTSCKNGQNIILNDLQVGEQYKFQVWQAKALGSYTMTIK